MKRQIIIVLLSLVYILILSLTVRTFDIVTETTDIENWKHPTKAVLNRYGMEIFKVKLLNKTYPIFYVNYNMELNRKNLSRFETLINDLAKANAFWNFRLADSNKDILIDVQCNRSSNIVTVIKFYKCSDNNEVDKKVILTIIPDLDNWSHPVKEVFTEYNIKLNRLELYNNDTYPVFYVSYKFDFSNPNEDLFKKVAKANAYWDFKIEGDVFGTHIMCDRKKKSIKNRTSYPKVCGVFTYEMLLEPLNNEVLQYLVDSVPEIKILAKHLDKFDNVSLIMYICGQPDDHYNYYTIYVGEDHPEHTVNWYYFNVSEDLNETIVEIIPLARAVSLDEWRECREIGYEEFLKNHPEYH